jgi:3'-phosphoadenosine 5'-phosphosulfate (PAPS) 3'-phosphatase
LGGCGKKFIHLLDDNFNTIINLSDKSSRWDVCAGHAIVLAAGGTLSTLQGLPIIYDPQADSYFNACVTNQ